MNVVFGTQNNAGGKVFGAQIPTSITLPVPTGNLIIQNIGGQTLNLSGTATDTSSVTLSIPTASTPNGAIAINNVVGTLVAGNFSFIVNDIEPGSYGALTVTLTGTGGATNLTGTAFEVINIDGQPQAGGTVVDTVPPVLTGNIVISNLTSSGYTATSPVATDDIGVGGYQWRIGTTGVFTNIPAQGRSVGITGRTAGSTDTFQMRAYDLAANYSSIISTNVTLQSGPLILTQPVSQTVTASLSATFSVLATGTSLQYQWQINVNGSFSDIPSATSSSYSTGSTNVSQNGSSYRCIITDSFGASVITNIVTLTVNVDVTAPVMVGSLLVSSVTTNSFVLSWSAATDNVAVTGYELSIDNGLSYLNVGNVLTRTITGATPSTSYQCKVRAYDAVGNKATPLFAVATALSTTVTTQIISDGSGTPLANAIMNYSYWPAGRLGSLAGITPIEGTVSADSTGRVTLNTLPQGTGILMLGFRGTTPGNNSTTDKVYYQATTIV